MQYAVLRGFDRGNVFWTPVAPGQTPEELVRNPSGKLAYKILGMFDTQEEAQELWRRSDESPDIIRT